MVKIGQKVQVCIDNEPAVNAEILERIEREYGLVYVVTLEGGSETMIVNESQLLASPEAMFFKPSVPPFPYNPSGEEFDSERLVTSQNGDNRSLMNSCTFGNKK